DCGLVERITRESNLKYTHFLRDELVVIVRDGHPLANKEELTMDEFRANGLVLRERGSGTLDVFEKALSRLNIKLSMLNVQLFLGSTESIKLYLEHTDAMGVVSIRSVAREVVLGRFKIIDVPALFMEREFSFIELHGEGNPLVEQFMRFAAKYKEKL
ncbi:MAG: LysR family transcriptional regulator, partial [Bacteroidales bacterium]|nr:LysR family transcriptional regulator [Bacteroidales bacterium]